MKDVAEVDELLELPSLRGAHCAAVVHRVVAQHPDRHPGDPREAGDLRAAVVAVELKEGTPVNHQLNELARVVATIPVPGNDGEQIRFAAIDRVIALGDGRHLMHIGREVGEKGSDLVKQFVLVGDIVVDYAALARMHLVAAEIFLGDLLAQRTGDQGRSAGEDLGRPSNHHGEVTGRYLGRGKSRH